MSVVSGNSAEKYSLLWLHISLKYAIFNVLLMNGKVKSVTKTKNNLCEQINFYANHMHTVYWADEGIV